MIAPASVPAAAPVHREPVTALQLADRILAAASTQGEVMTATDRIVAGDPTTVVTGIATVAMASVDALRTAAAKGCNLVVSYDPTFWSDGDQLDHVAGNRLFAAKRDFIRAHSLVVLDLHDCWQHGIDTGMARTLGWDAYRQVPGQPLYASPRTTLLALARSLGTILDDRTMRVVGDPVLPVVRVAASWGNARQLSTIALLNGSADVVVCGYSHEWEAVMYAQDMIATGAKKGLILLGQAKSVDGGMRYCAEWMRPIVSDISVTHIPASEPYWNSQQTGDRVSNA
jgi:putative NIF3 family GTP cyclohydrolase 1 type 2